MKTRPVVAAVLAVILIVGFTGIAASEGLGKYKDVSKAEDDGYLPPAATGIPYCIPEMGIHYLNPTLVDDEVQVGNPEVLVYAEDNGDLRLLGVEYLSTDPFTVYGHEGEFESELGLYALHAWLFTDAPNGKHAHHSGDVDVNCQYIGDRP